MSKFDMGGGCTTVGETGVGEGTTTEFRLNRPLRQEETSDRSKTPKIIFKLPTDYLSTIGADRLNLREV